MSNPVPRSGLGRGLGQLIQNTDRPPRTNRPVDQVIDSGSTANRAPPAGSYYAEIPIESVTPPNPRQPRVEFDPDLQAELVESIQEVGLLQPVVVRPPLPGQRFELVMGERRWRASKEAGKTAIPAIVRGTEEGDMLRDALLENLHRAQLNPLEEANAYQQLLDDFGCTQEELSQRIKRSRPQISNTLRLLKLPAPVQRRIAAGVLSAGHAKALLSLSDPAHQEHLAQRVVAEGLSVRATEELVHLSADTPPAPTSRPAAKAPSPPQAVELTERLSSFFDTRAKVDIGKSKGKIVIEFAGEEDLHRILELMQLKSGE